MKKQKIAQGILTALTVCAIALIFLNSSKTAQVSDGMSLGFLGWLEGVLCAMHIDAELSNHLIRKAAHFTEFFVLGALLMGTTCAYSAHVTRHVFKPLFVGLLVPVLDETIQLFVQGRSGQVSDVLLDFSGALTAILLLLLIFCLQNKHRARKKA